MPAASLVSVVLSLEPAAEVEVPAHLGRAAHAFFLDLVRRHDPALAGRLHDEESTKPFTASGLLGAPAPTNNRCTLRPGAAYFLRFTTFEPALSQLLLERVLPDLPQEIRLEAAILRTKAIFRDAGDNALAACSSHEELSHGYLADKSAAPTRLAFHFASPTTFRSQGKNIPFPLPGLVFASLMEKWNAFAPIALHPDLKRYAEECLALARYDLHTQLIEVGGGKHVGFQGSATYIALIHDSYWLKQINLLADFAFYSGTGAKTTMGMGQTRRITYARSLSGRTGVHPPQRR